jgi:hypothetical protein
MHLASSLQTVTGTSTSCPKAETADSRMTSNESVVAWGVRSEALSSLVVSVAHAKWVTGGDGSGGVVQVYRSRMLTALVCSCSNRRHATKAAFVASALESEHLL